MARDYKQNLLHKSIKGFIAERASNVSKKAYTCTFYKVKNMFEVENDVQ